MIDGQSSHTVNTPHKRPHTEATSEHTQEDFTKNAPRRGKHKTLRKRYFTHRRGHEDLLITTQWETDFLLIGRHGRRVVAKLRWGYAKDDTGKRNACIEWLWTQPEYRRLGIARTMIRVFLANTKLRHVEWVSYWTGLEIEKTGGHSLYVEMGFREMCVQKDYYAKGCPTRMFGMKIGKGRSNKSDVQSV